MTAPPTPEEVTNAIADALELIERNDAWSPMLRVLLAHAAVAEARADALREALRSLAVYQLHDWGKCQLCNLDWRGLTEAHVRDCLAAPKGAERV